MTASQPTGKIVIGVDGSASSVDALRWAVQQSQLVGAELHAVSSWVLPNTYGWSPAPADTDWQRDSETVLRRTLTEALGATDAERVHQHVVQGHPAAVLLEAAADADLLVVGSRGHGGFTGMLLGSVSQHVIAHAPCPVVVVRHQASATDEPAS